MLEEPCLHVAPWTRATSGETAWIRVICHPLGRPLGVVRFVGKVKPAWLTWLSGRRLDVYETDDVSHLMTLVRPWGIFRMWDVYDADERFVGSIYPPSLIDSDGLRCGTFDVCERGDGSILDPDGQVVAWFRMQNSTAIEVTFATDRSVNPFMRMLFLAGVLEQDSSPSR